MHRWGMRSLGNNNMTSHQNPCSRIMVCAKTRRFVEVIALLNILISVSGNTQTLYVDACATGTGNGTSGNPFNSLAGGASASAPGGTINLRCGNYGEALTINKPLILDAFEGSAKIGVERDHLWAGVNNGDIFDVPDVMDDPDKTLGAMLDELAAADLRVIRIFIDYRLELDDDGNATPMSEYNDCILEAIDNLMLEAKRRGLLLLIVFDAHNWYDSYYMSHDWYAWRRCQTPSRLFAQLDKTRGWTGGSYDSPHKQRIEAGLLGENNFGDQRNKDAYKKRVEHILNHRNPFFNNKKWKDLNDVVWAWELFNEPGYHNDILSWIHEMSAFVKGIDPDTYLALGTAWPDFLETYFVDVDIYTLHSYQENGKCTQYEDAIHQFRSPQGIGGRYDKLVFIEEFNYPVGGFESCLTFFESLDLPWMIWEYEWFEKQYAIWPGRNDPEWSIIVHHAAELWNKFNCACDDDWNSWHVGRMVESLSPSRTQ